LQFSEHKFSQHKVQQISGHCNGQELRVGGPARPPGRRLEGMRPATPASKGRAGPDGAGRASAAGPAMA